MCTLKRLLRRLHQRLNEERGALDVTSGAHRLLPKRLPRLLPRPGRVQMRAQDFQVMEEQLLVLFACCSRICSSHRRDRPVQGEQASWKQEPALAVRKQRRPCPHSLADPLHRAPPSPPGDLSGRGRPRMRLPSPPPVTTDGCDCLVLKLLLQPTPAELEARWGSRCDSGSDGESLLDDRWGKAVMTKFVLLVDQRATSRRRARTNKFACAGWEVHRLTRASLVVAREVKPGGKKVSFVH